MDVWQKLHALKSVVINFMILPYRAIRYGTTDTDGTYKQFAKHTEKDIDMKGDMHWAVMYNN